VCVDAALRCCPDMVYHHWDTAEGSPLVGLLALFSAGVMSTNDGRALLQSPSAWRHDALPFAGAMTLQQSACTANWRLYSTLENATAVWSRNTSEYNLYGGVDLNDGPSHLEEACREERLTPRTSEPVLMVGECTAEAPGGVACGTHSASAPSSHGAATTGMALSSPTREYKFGKP
jgi:hypothetical protein